MILTVTLNPLLEYRYTFDKVITGASNRFGRESRAPGGKGINVSRQLNLLGIKNFAFTFLGGSNGNIVKELMKGEGIDFSSVRTHSESRTAAVVIDSSAERVTTFFGNNSAVSGSEAEEFKSKLYKTIQNCEIAVFSGSSPCEETDDIFPFGIETANKFDKVSICDTYGSHLRLCIEKAPTIIHNNADEIRESLQIPMEKEKDKLEFLDYLYKKNVKQTFLTDGPNNVYAGSFDFHYKAVLPKIRAVDSTGSGDAFVAGIIYGWNNSLTFEESLRIACALGTANAERLDVCTVTLDEVQEIKDQIKISPVGKRLKTIDAVPD